MSKLFLILIEIYQNIISVFLKNILGIGGSCRFFPTCSNFAKQSITKYGAARGGIMAIERFLKCQPFVRPQYDRS